jgi:hypothetical protein
MGTLNLQVASGADDIYQVEGGTTVDNSLSVLTIGTAVDPAASPDRHFLIRWTSLTGIASGENIISATLQLRKNTTEWKNQYWTIKGYAVDNAGQPTRIDNLAMTTANVVVDDNKNDTADTWYTWDVTAIVQEIVNRAGWASGNAIALIFIGTGTTSGGANKVYYSYDGAAASAPKLDIVYGPPPPVNTPVAVTFVNMTTNGNTAATTSCILTKPTNTQQGDILIAGMIIELAAPTVTAPTGWTLEKSGTPGGTSRALRLLVYSHIVQASDAATTTWTWTVTTGYEWAGFMSAYRNAKVGNSVISTTNSSSVSAVSPTVTTLATNALVLAIACSAYGTTWTPPTANSGYTERVDYRSSTGTANVSITQSESLYAAAAATGTATNTAANADYWVAAHIVLERCATERAMLGRYMPPVIDVWR